MPQRRNPLRDEARRLWEESGRTRSLEDIARQLGVPGSRLRKWKTEDQWEKERSDSEIQIEKERKGAERARKQRERRADKRAVAAVQQNEALTEQERLFCLHYSKSFNATQSYLKAYRCIYSTANAEGCKLLVKPSIRDEILRLKQMRQPELLAGEADLVDMHMRIAFADITDYVDFGERQEPVLEGGQPVYALNQDTIEMTPETKTVKKARLRSSHNVDGQLIREVRQSKDGTVIKLEDRQKSLAFLERYFTANPMDRHRRDYDNARLKMAQEKHDALNGDSDDLKRVADLLTGVYNAAKSKTD